MTNITEYTPFSLLEYYVEQALIRQSISDDYKEEKDTYLAFRAGEGHFLLNIKYILEITIGLTGITPLPFSPKWILGLVSSRGDVYSVIDFRWFNNLNDISKSAKLGSFIILRDEGMGYILKVDEILGSSAYDVQDNSEDEEKSPGWIDGDCLIGEKVFHRISLVNLVTNNKFIQSIQ